MEKLAPICGTTGIMTTAAGVSIRVRIRCTVAVDGDLMSTGRSNDPVLRIGIGRLSGAGVVSTATGATAVGLVRALFVGVAPGRTLVYAP